MESVQTRSKVPRYPIAIGLGNFSIKLTLVSEFIATEIFCVALVNCGGNPGSRQVEDKSPHAHHRVRSHDKTHSEIRCVMVWPLATPFALKSEARPSWTC